jgi:hypothetical protein
MTCVGITGGDGNAAFVSGRSSTAPHAAQNADAPVCSLPHEGQLATQLAG